jgi:hypothetical protein
MAKPIAFGLLINAVMGFTPFNPSYALGRNSHAQHRSTAPRPGNEAR